MPPFTAKNALFFITALCLLAACAPERGPWPMASGYVYHGKEYKAPPGPEADISWWQRKKRDLKMHRNPGGAPDPSVTVSNIDAVLPYGETAPAQGAGMDTGWDNAAAALVGQIMASSGGRIDKLTLQPGDGMDPGMSSSFGDALRRALQNQGVALGQGTYVLRYYARSTAAGTVMGDTFLLLDLSSGGKSISEQSGFFTTGAAAHVSETPAYESGMPLMITP